MRFSVPHALRAAPFTLLLVLLAGTLVDAKAQAAGAWTFALADRDTRVREVGTAGYPAVAVADLRALGAEVVPSAGGATVRIGGAEAVLRAGSPFFSANGAVYQLLHPVYEAGGALFVPVQFVVEHLPALAGGETAVDLAARAVRRGAPAAVRVASASAAAPAPAAPTRSAPAPSASSEAPRRSGGGAPAGASAAPAATPPAAAPASRAAPTTRPAPAETPPARSTPAPAPARTPAPPAARRLVVIDPGHGGVDPGAKGPGGHREKDIALAVARRLAATLREDPNLEVRMTRDRDTLIALRDRTRMANRWRQEGQDALFISIHTNAHQQRSVRGFETFFLSDAKTEDARRVADMENAAQQYEEPDKKLDPLSFILHDLRQNKYLRDSSSWAAMVQARMAAVHPGPNRGVKQAGFVVLNGAFMPAVLVELGFITHPEEEKMLADAAHQGRLARELARSVRDFFERSASAQAAGR